MTKALENDNELIHAMLLGINKVPEIYRPSPYWLAKTKNSAREILKFGLKDFRGSTNNIGTSYSDNGLVDVRGQYNYGLRLLLSILMKRAFPLSRIFDSQVRLTEKWFHETVKHKNVIANTSERVKELLEKFNMPNDTIRGGCLNYCDIKNKKIANHYLELLHTHEILARHIDFKKARTYFEIGGGFGANLHLLIENYSNIRKVIYLDIMPNLYIGTQYLKSFYGKGVKTFFESSRLRKISFSLGDELEIFCIAPHQIESLDVVIDIFQNSHSFVEMSSNIVKNYVKYIEKMTSPNNSAIGLISYDGGDEQTLKPDSLPKYFSRKFMRYEEQTLWRHDRHNYYYVANSR
jgi:putative sugar O-methyltransferase